MKNDSSNSTESSEKENEVFGFELQGDALVRAMERIARSMRLCLESACDKVPGGMSTGWVLRHLESSGRQSQASIARSIGVSSSTLTVRLKQMEKAQLISRQPDRKDHRRNTIALSERGAVLCREARERSVAEVDRLMAGADTWDIDAFRRVMRVIQENLFRLDADSNRDTHRRVDSVVGVFSEDG